jgi:hypothetical protein
MDLYGNKKALSELTSLYNQMNESSYLETDMEKRRKNNEKAVEDMKKTKAHKDMTKAARKAMGIDEAEDREMRKLAAQERAAERKREATRPGRKSITPGKKAAGAGKDYADYQSKSIEAHDKVTKKAKITVGNPFPEEVQYVDEAKKGKKPNDGNLANNYPPYDKVTRGDVIAGRLGKDEMGGKKKKVKESYSNWRHDLSEILDTEDDKQIKEKKVKNKVVIDPDLKLEDIAHELGAEIIEVIELGEESYMDYAKRKQAEKKDTRMTVTAADKKANTPAYQNYKTGDKRYKAAAGVDEEFEVEEGMTMKDFKANRKKNQRRSASADAEKRGHVGKEWHNTGRKYSPDEAKSGRANMSDYNRQQRYQTAEDPDSDNADTYPASKTKNPKKLRKQKAMGEGYLSEKSLSRAQQRFMGMVYAAKKGETPASPEVAKAASGMSKKSAKDFAGTKHKGLPEKKVSKEEFEQLDERRKEDKAAGTPRKPRDRAFEYVAKMMGSNRLGVQPRGKKKEPGKKPPKAGEYGGPVSPAQKVAKRRAAAQRAQDNMSSRYD